MKKINQVSKIASQQLNIPVLSIKQVHTGFDHHIFFVKTIKKEFVFRLPRTKTHNLPIQAWAAGQWLKRGVPVPKIIHQGKNYLVEEKICGKDMGHSRLTLHERQKIFFQVGKMLRKMHTIKTKRYGPLIKIRTGGKTSWELFISNRLKQNLTTLRKNKFLSKKTLASIKKTCQTHKDYLNYHDPRLLHFDLSDVNIMVHNKKFKAIIDHGDAASGDPLYELGAMQAYFHDRTLPSLFKGYGKTDPRKVNFYAFLHSLFLTHFFLTEVRIPRVAKRFFRRALYYEKKLNL